MAHLLCAGSCVDMLAATVCLTNAGAGADVR